MAFDLGESVAGMMPSSQTIVQIFTFIGVGILLAVIAGGVVWWTLDKKKFNKIIRLHKKINGTVVLDKCYKASITRVGNAGDVWFVVKGGKILPRPKLEYMKNVYNYYEREDGEWINFNIQDIDVKMKLAKVFYLDEDMRLHRLGIQKNLESRLQKEGFWKTWGGIIGMAVFVLIITVCLIVLFNKLSLLADGLGRVGDTLGSIVAQNTNNGLVPISDGVQV